MKKFLHLFGFHFYKYNDEIETERWGNYERNYERSYQRDYNIGSCEICGRKKKVYFN